MLSFQSKNECIAYLSSLKELKRSSSNMYFTTVTPTPLFSEEILQTLFSPTFNSEENEWRVSQYCIYDNGCILAAEVWLSETPEGTLLTQYLSELEPPEQSNMVLA
ncbi:hypothetical protein JCM30760_26790 [Thiomicrorhabdus hydrogeniphila]